MAAGGFVSRAFETMLKESGGKKFPDLQKAIQAYQGALFCRSQAEGEGAKTGGEADEPQKVPSGEVAEQASQSKSGTINISLANAGHTLGGAEVELVLKPLRLAFETKNLKIFDAALDCLHKLIAYDHLEGDPGLDGGKNSAPFTEILNMVCSCIDNSSPDSTVLQVLKVLLTAVASGKFKVHGEPLLGVIRVCYNIALNSKSPINQATSKAMLTQMISIVFRRMETDIVSSSSSVSQEEHVSGDSSSLKTEEIIAADQSEKEMTLGDALTQAKDTTLASVEELHTLVGGADIKGMLEGVSHSFTKNFHFIDSVKAYLSYALLRASVSQSSVIFQYASGIFSVLLLRFRDSLKGEIGIFFPIIVLRSLDSSECPNDQKMGVLRMLEKVCKDPQMLVDVYVNYDCDLEAPNLFERMVTTLSKIAQGTQSADPNPAMASQTASVKGSSLQCLVNVLKSLVDWEKIRREAENSTRHVNEDSDSAREPVETKSREDVPSNFEKAKAHKSTMEAAISEFNRNSVKGIEYLIANKLVERNPASVAQFLRSTSSLKKVMIGDYLGQHEEFPLAVMHAYVDSMKFSEMKFHTAIREFLKGFRLPGEAQKIDRIMEKFAERYCADNPGLFKNADTAYVLAYAVIMLNTDAHNPMVWPKMSKSDFIRMNATTDPEDCAPTELLEEIYDSIVKEEIKLKDDDSSIRKINSQRPGGEGGLVSILNLGLPKRISAADAKSETEDIVRKTQEIFRKDGVKRGVFHTVEQVDIIRPMVEAVGWPLLAAFSVTMEVGDNKPRILLCMEGFKAGIHIAFVLGMDTMRYAFLTSLVRFTFLHAPKEMRSKNVEALRILLALCDSEPDTLQDTWNAVLECVSRLEFIVSTPGITATVMHGSNQISRDGVVQSLKELAGRPAEQVFVNSVKLPSESVVEFFTALCGVSAEELKQSPARVFSLQKLVEISYYNIARIRMGLIPGGVLKPVNTNEDETFDVTEHYWYPMLAGLSDLTSDFRPEVRNCALEVLFDLLNERGKKFSTPFWESIFHRILFPIFDHVSHAGKEGLVSSGDVQFRETSIHSLQLLCNLFNTFYKEVCFMLPPLLSLLLDCAKKSDQTVVSISLGALVHLIEVGGHQFSEGDWDMLLKSIRDASYTTQPLELLNDLGFDNPNKNLVVTGDIEADATDSPRVDHNPDDNGKGSAQASPRVGIHGASQESRIQPKDDGSEGRPSSSGRSQKEGDDLNIQRSQTFGQRFMDNLFLRNLTSQPKSSAAEVSVPSSPHKQVDPAEPDNREEESPALGTIRGKCITQLLLLGAINSIQKKYWSNLKTAQKIAIMDILFSFIEFAASYNSYSNLRTRMNHISAERPPLNLLRQELEGTNIYMDVLHKTTTGLGDAASDTEDKLEGAAEEKLVSFCEQVLKETSDLQSSLGESTNMDVHRVLELRSPVIVKVLEGMCFMNNKIFRKHMREFYPLLTRLMDIRGALANLFTAQLKPLLQQ
ncbi:hypothetical protein F2Q68_00004946 [Brassica cretica]|uniref:SEC7 domain-containing protein n=1 Tax=Brassica cretica TaxID=69181 RepID=A0A8S9JAY2_BRACR|nr:hypothetical protein F2Q68_00004946 [Brassica cretica]